MTWPEKEFRKVETPEYCPGSYDLALYCDHENPEHEFREFPHTFTDGYETGSQARKAARRAGWVIHKDRTATCPKCARRLRGDPLLAYRSTTETRSGDNQ
jgi:hypothetical protein